MIKDAGASVIITDGQGVPVVATLSVVTPQHFPIPSAKAAHVKDRPTGNRFPSPLQPCGLSTVLQTMCAISSIL